MKKSIIIISSICTLCAFTALVYFIFIHQSVADYLETAKSAMHEGDLKTAEKNFLEVIARDNANETAYKSLAEIAEKNKRPFWAARYWKIAASLNPLSKEIHEKYINSLIKANRYYTIIEQFKNKEIESLSNLDLYALARANYFKNDIAETKKLLAALLIRTPKDPKVILLNARFLLTSGNHQEAKKLFTSLLSSPDKTVRTNALIGLGHSDIAINKTKKAGSYYQKAVKNSPDSMEVLMILANYNLNTGNLKQAEQQYKELHKNLPENIIVTITLAEIYTKNKNSAAIKKLLSTIKTSNQTTIAAKYYLRALLAYIANEPEKLKQNMHLCKTFSNRPLYAYLQFQDILDSNNILRINSYVTNLLKMNDSKVARTDLANQIRKAALKNFKDKKFETSAALAAIMEKLLPKEPACAHLSMICAYEQQKWRKAISMADKFNQLAPDTLDYLSVKGRSLLYLNEAEEALPLLKKLTVLNPKKPEVWLWAAQAYQQLGNQKEVESCIEKMLSLANNSHNIIDPAVSFFLARNNKKIADKIASHLLLSKDKTFKAMAWSIKAQVTDNPREAVKYLLKAYELKKDTDSLLFIADIYLQGKKYNEAMQYVDKVLKTSPDSPKALFRQAVIFQTINDNEKAVKVYKKLLEKYPKWSLVLVNLSDIMAAKGKKKEALALARKAQAESGSWPRAKLCLGLRELDCKNYSSALPLFEQLIKQDPGNKIVRTALSNCLIPIIRENIEKKYFTLARQRLQQLKRIAPEAEAATTLDKLLTAGEKAGKSSTELL